MMRAHRASVPSFALSRVGVCASFGMPSVSLEAVDSGWPRVERKRERHLPSRPGAVLIAPRLPVGTDGTPFVVVVVSEVEVGGEEEEVAVSYDGTTSPIPLCTDAEEKDEPELLDTPSRTGGETRDSLEVDKEEV